MSSADLTSQKILAPTQRYPTYHYTNTGAIEEIFVTQLTFIYFTKA